MALRESTLGSQLAELDRQLAQMRGNIGVSGTAVIDRFRLDLGAAGFHLKFGTHRPMLVAIVGGTGTGKSTLVNRLLGVEVTATSFRRTFTAGAVAVAKDSAAIPDHWLNLDPMLAGPGDLPVRGKVDSLAVVKQESAITERVTLIDTPDLDGDQPLHHAQADRVFRWAQGILFLVTPEKYQMTELVPYYRTAQRYGLPSVFVMNKAEEAAVVEDYQRVVQRITGKSEQRFFALSRDGSSYEPPSEMNLESLRTALTAMEAPAAEDRRTGIAARVADLMDRVRDQILQPLRKQRALADQMIGALRAMESPIAGVDVNPLTRQLQRRLQQRSVLYLMGPGKMLDRVRQVPNLLARLPRTAWDLLRHGQIRNSDEQKLAADWDRAAPNFNAALADQFTIVQSRIDDTLRSDSTVEKWIEEDSAGYAAAKIAPSDAGKIADEQIADLRDWLTSRWNATPRDTALLKKILKLVPGGEKLTQWSEAAPYLLALVVAAHHALFGPVDLMVVGGFSLATWLIERLNNEVAARTRLTNRRVEEQFAKMAHRQIEAMCGWIQGRAPSEKELDGVEELADRIGESVS
jgi:energy-coupling factor transporter ATP-binding protein EcfA2